MKFNRFTLTILLAMVLMAGSAFAQPKSLSAALEPGFGAGNGLGLSVAGGISLADGFQVTGRLGHSLTGPGGVALAGVVFDLGQLRVNNRTFTFAADVQAGLHVQPAGGVFLWGVSVSTPVRGPYSIGAGVHMNIDSHVHSSYVSTYVTVGRSF